MSLTKTLIKVAIGVAIVKGVSSLARGSSGSDTGSTTRSTRSSGSKPGLPGGLDDLMTDVLGGGKTSRTSRTGSGDLLEEITGTKRSTTRKTAPKGGLDGMLEELTRGTRTTGGTGRSTRGTADTGFGGGLGDLLGQVLGGAAAGGRQIEIDPREELSAALVLRAMIQAIKCDGQLDAAEKQKLMDAMGEASRDEVAAVNAELAAPVDIDALVRQVPQGMEAQVYMASLAAIDLDQQAEAQYLHGLAQALELAPHEVNALHDRAGAPHLYR